MALTPEGDGIVTGSDAGLFLRSGPELTSLKQLPSEVESIHDLQFSADGKRLAVAGGTPGQFGLIEILEWPAAVISAEIRQHDDVVYSVSWSPDHKWLATASHDGVCMICDSRSGIPHDRIEGHSKGVTGVEWLSPLRPSESAAEDLILTCSIDHSLRVWSLDMESHDTAPRLVRTMAQHTGAVTGMVRQRRNTGASASVVASWSDDRTVRFWQPENGRMLRFARLPHTVMAAAWSTDGRVLYASTRDGSISKVHLSTAQFEEIGRFERFASSMLLSQDSRQLILGNSAGECSEFRIPE